MFDFEYNDLRNLNNNFEVIGKSAMDCTQFIQGRPYGGVCIFYRKKFTQHLKVLETSNKCTQAVLLEYDEQKLMLVNVYFLCNTPSNDEAISECIQNVIGLWNTVDCTSVVIIGDFNLDPKTNKFKELQEACAADFLRLVDVEVFPHDTHTYISNQTGGVSWLDHIVVSNNMTCSNLIVSNTILSSDHLLISTELVLKVLPVNDIAGGHRHNVCKKLSWNKTNSAKKQLYKKLTCLESSIVDCEAMHCMRKRCRDLNHWNKIDSIYECCMNVLNRAEEKLVTASNSQHNYVKEGWNSYVKTEHTNYRSLYLKWVAYGKIPKTQEYIDMSIARSQFKKALRKSRIQAETDRMNKLVTDFGHYDFHQFWQKVKEYDKSSNLLSQRIDGVNGEKECANQWGLIYKKLFEINSTVDKDENVRLHTRINDESCMTNGFVFDHKDIVDAIHKLGNNK